MNASLAAKVRNVIAGHFGIEADRLVDEAHLREDLGADWLDRLELLILIEDQVTEFEINDAVIEQIETVGDLMRALEEAARGGRRTHKSFDSVEGREAPITPGPECRPAAANAVSRSIRR